MTNAWLRILVSSLMFLVALIAGLVCYRGPAPLPLDSPDARPSAARMRLCLEELLGTPAVTHSTGTRDGVAFLERLERKIRSLGVSTSRIECPWDDATINDFREKRPDWIPEELVLRNLIATIVGRDPSLSPVLVATHHDSCRFGPGAGDAGSAIVACVENLRILAKHRPLRTVHFLFTDGEEYGLLGAKKLSELEELPFARPVFVLNFDARGSERGVPMFETHPGNDAAVSSLINCLARPRITSSLAVTVYRTLPNATDFNVWSGEMGLSGFNFATIGGAHRYHQLEDTPDHLSGRTLQHMGNHLYEMHRAIDVDPFPGKAAIVSPESSSGNVVFFDVFGLAVLHFGQTLQRWLAVSSFGLLFIQIVNDRKIIRARRLFSLLGVTVLWVVSGVMVGWLVQGVLRSTPWSQLKYTPVDLWAGLLTIVAAFLIATMGLEQFVGRAALCHRTGESTTWLITGLLGLIMAFQLPGGAYLLVLPSLSYAVTRCVWQPAASWVGWCTMVVLVGPLLTLLVQATGPWQQAVYGAIAALLAVLAMTTWSVSGESVGETTVGSTASVRSGEAPS